MQHIVSGVNQLVPWQTGGGSFYTAIFLSCLLLFVFPLPESRMLSFSAPTQVSQRSPHLRCAPRPHDHHKDARPCAAHRIHHANRRCATPPRAPNRVEHCAPKAGYTTDLAPVLSRYSPYWRPYYPDQGRTRPTTTRTSTATTAITHSSTATTRTRSATTRTSTATGRTSAAASTATTRRRKAVARTQCRY